LARFDEASAIPENIIAIRRAKTTSNKENPELETKAFFIPEPYDHPYIIYLTRHDIFQQILVFTCYNKKFFAILWKSLDLKQKYPIK